ncbi:MAG TPA: phosphoribosylaminoimidazolesuccinocarboxamide synthase [Candidatus Paceibacterota bacterium]
MKPIPKQVKQKLLQGLDFIARGKVCELYSLPDHPGLLLKVVSDRASVHDIILPFLVPHKGEVLNFIDHFWRQLFPNIAHDVVAVGSDIDEYLPKNLRGNLVRHRRSRIIKSCEAVSAEIIYRHLLTGTGLKKYQQYDGVVCGQQFPAGLKEWDELEPSAFTPTTKDPDGHDEHMDVEVFASRFGMEPMFLTSPVFKQGKDIAAKQGVIIADTKFEVGRDEFGRVTLIDEVLTPDSSRYLKPEDVEEARRTGKRPPSFDKQPIRDYVQKYLGVGPETPLTEEVVDKVHSHQYPRKLIEQTSERYVELLRLLTGLTPDQYAATL